MGYFRLFKRFKVLPGISLNISKSGFSIAVGPRGLKATFVPEDRRDSRDRSLLRAIKACDFNFTNNTVRFVRTFSGNVLQEWTKTY
jgi:hypothetical protein